MKKIWIGAALCLLTTSTAWAVGEKNSRPATKADLVGTWDLVSVRPIRDAKDPVFFPYQRFAFAKDSSMKSMVSDKPFTQDWLDKFNKQPGEIDFSINEKGILSLTWSARPHNETAIAAFVLEDIPPDLVAKVPKAERGALPKKGNVVLSYLNNSGKISYQKILTRIG